MSEQRTIAIKSHIEALRVKLHVLGVTLNQLEDELNRRGVESEKIEKIRINKNAVMNALRELERTVG